MRMATYILNNFTIKNEKCQGQTMDSLDGEAVKKGYPYTLRTFLVVKLFISYVALRMKGCVMCA